MIQIEIQITHRNAYINFKELGVGGFKFVVPGSTGTKYID